jgi:PmbA protein
MIASQLVERAMRAAQGAQASVRRTESTSVSFENDQLKSTRSAQRTQIEVKVIVNGKIGISTTTDVADLEGVVDRALECAQFGSIAHYTLPGPGPSTGVQVYDEGVVRLSKPEMIELGGEMMGEIKAYNAQILVEAGVNKHVHQVEFANSAGVAFDDKSTDLTLWTSGQLIRGTDILEAGYGLSGKRRHAGPQEVAGVAIGWFRLAERNASIRSGDLPVILTPEATNVLALTLQLALDGKNVLLGSSPLAGRVGETIADPRFSLTDDPLVDWGPRSSRYDGEGVSRQATPLIEQGVLMGYLYDLDTAGRAGAKSTGHGPTREPTNLIVAEGDTPYEKMVRGIDEGLLVHRVMGLGQGNPISGEFSVNVSLGYKVEKGEVVGRVKDVMLAGNVYDALHDIAAIGDRAEWVSAWLTGRMPYIQIGKLSVVAK